MRPNESHIFVLYLFYTGSSANHIFFSSLFLLRFICDINETSKSTIGRNIVHYVTDRIIVYDAYGYIYNRPRVGFFIEIVKVDGYEL